MALNLLTEEVKTNLSNPKVFKFKTDAQKFKINFSVNNKSAGNYPHMGISLREGIMVLFRKVQENPDDNSNERTWYNVEAYTERFDTTVYMHHLVHPDEEYEIMIYGPVLSQIESMEIETPENTNIEIIENSFDKKFLVCGGLTSLGIGCTTPASIFPSILCRKLNASVDNITFNDKNYLNHVHDYFKKNTIEKEYDVGILELEYSNQDDKITKLYLQKDIEYMSKRCKHVIAWICVPPYREYKKDLVQDIIKDTPVDNLVFEDLSFLYDKEYSDICTYSGNFINDSGNMMIYRKLSEIIRGL